MSKEQWKELLKNLLERAAWTFIQGFLVALPTTGGELTKSALLAACMAGLSALKTFILDYGSNLINKKKSAEEEEKTEE